MGTVGFLYRKTGQDWQDPHLHLQSIKTKDVGVYYE